MHQLNMVCKVIGSPSAAEIAAVPSDKARSYLTSMPFFPKGGGWVGCRQGYAGVELCGAGWLAGVLAWVGSIPACSMHVQCAMCSLCDRLPALAPCFPCPQTCSSTFPPPVHPPSTCWTDCSRLTQVCDCSARRALQSPAVSGA